MPNLLIRDIPEGSLKNLKKIAEAHNRSLQQELKDKIIEWSELVPVDTSRRAASIIEKLRSKKISFTDSTKLLREDRGR